MLTDVAATYSAVFAPEFFLLACLLVLGALEWRTHQSNVRTLAARFAVVLVAWAAAYAVNETLPEVLPDAAWASDFAASVALLVGVGAIHAAWRVRDWGGAVLGYTRVVLALTVVHLVVTPLWSFSGHVAYTAAPALVLADYDHRFAPLLAVSAGMVPARVLAAAHTWPESAGGLVVAAGVWYGVARWRARRGHAE